MPHRYIPCPQGCGNTMRKRSKDMPEMCGACRRKERTANKLPHYIPCPMGCGGMMKRKSPAAQAAMCRPCRDKNPRRDEFGHFLRNDQPIPPRRVVVVEPPVTDPLLAPQDHLWFERELVFSYVYGEVGESVRTELSKHPGMAERWDAWRSRPWLRFDQVDDLLCVLGLWVGDLGDPVYSEKPNRYPVLEAA